MSTNKVDRRSYKGRRKTLDAGRLQQRQQKYIICENFNSLSRFMRYSLVTDRRTDRGAKTIGSRFILWVRNPKN
ncbi:hypothetical protein B5X24_HaOG209365 [Helicoverpa armigera]|nr:hypothetical protein B5X24_HaOG209365 [Helicoverpa armigera]